MKNRKPFRLLPLLVIASALLLVQQPAKAQQHTNKFVTIQYSTWTDFWQGAIQSANNNIEQSPTSSYIGQPFVMPDCLSHNYWGGYACWHWWGRPAYAGGNIAAYRFVNTNGTPNNDLIDYHANMLSDAGIDFISIDATNYDHDTIPEQCDIAMAGVLAVIQRYSARISSTPLIVTPKIAFYANNAKTAKYLWDTFYASGSYSNVFFNYAGKPLLLIRYPDNPMYPGGPNQAPGDLAVLSNFTFKKTWGLQGPAAATQWSFKECSTIYGTPSPTCIANLWPEQRSVTAAAQETNMFPNTSTAHGRLNGNYFNWYWSVARSQSPTFIYVNSWNEWGAQDGEAPGSHSSPSFVDAYLTEYSADVEPMYGGHGSMYLNLLKTQIQNYKRTAPNLVLRDSTTGTWYFKYYYDAGGFQATNNSATFAWPAAAGSNFQSFVGDFNSDGFNDIGVRDVTNGVWHYAERFTGAPTPFWFNNNWNVTWAVGAQYQPLMADVDHDGHCDQIMRNSDNGVWYIRQGVAPYTFTNQFTLQWLTGSSYEALIADFNGDGRLDLGLRDKSTGNVYFATQNAQAFTFTIQGTYASWAGGSNFQAFAGDFQRDGKGDIALRDSNTGVIYLTGGWGDLYHFNNDDNVPFLAGSSYTIHAFDGK